ncbi:carboxypeptidase regulatory-like domain-containing protein [Leptospira kanakyensis]|uniref:Carboxypeptidase regulatory-like domain-containing protein n=1 Tax=Leptospira kanakyensis TaxID=2484968 RepID=A0A6N4QGF8_9LEPT|nr:carboxypeptidase-like regulatory domain-containing protein [Leptospira kanakyensis]TGK51704.1 carboxypeptidase regulatory-like domain-containing protein [Leptospira kanakyensis]TGK58595.1 carboxypeptidase regulatory-like domain-containing protein [Leptospira kanakyensis]TGK70798.1 carboxypeptidase regulatory-like domain-containing protein [Leptospira kanakyensis]
MRIQIHKIYFLIIFLPFFSDCYFNPVVNGILNPLEEEKNSGAFLGLLGFAPTTFGITGQLKTNDGIAVVGATIQIAGSDSNKTVTNEAGRFHLTGPAGSLQLQVNHNGTEFKLEILVMPPIAHLVSIENSGYTVSNLETYPTTSEIPSYFDLVSSRPYDGLIITSSNYTSILGFGFYFKFSENLEEVGDYNLWRDQNFIVSPTIGLGILGISPDSITIVIPPENYGIQTDYVLTLMPGIRSATGKALKQPAIRFRIESVMPL